MTLTILLSLRYVIFAYICKVIVGAGLLCIYWALAGVISKKKPIKIMIMVFLIALSCLILNSTIYHPDTVQMEENILYIKPK